jgi:septum formation protein
VSKRNDENFKFGRHLESLPGSDPVLVLASSSPYRRQLFERLGVPFTTCSPDIDETPIGGEPASATALRLAHAKAQGVVSRYPRDLIIGSDQVAVIGQTRLGKPGGYERALAQLQLVRGRAVTFHTALCVFDASTGRSQSKAVPTVVHFRNYSDAQAARYLEREQPYDCAGSAKIEGLGIALVDCVESDDPTALVGLPLMALVSLLESMGVDVL